MHRWLVFLVAVPATTAALYPSPLEGWRLPAAIIAVLAWSVAAWFEFGRPSSQSGAADHHRRETQGDAIADRYKGGGPPVTGG